MVLQLDLVEEITLMLVNRIKTLTAKVETPQTLELTKEGFQVINQ